MVTSTRRTVGAFSQSNGRTEFTVFAPYDREVELLIEGSANAIPLEGDDEGYWRTEVTAPPGTRYRYRFGGSLGEVTPDPASRFQPEGVHGPSEVVSDEFSWSDAAWRRKPTPLERYVIYEMHVGVATKGGTFDALIEDLPRIEELGVTAIELLPVAQFPGARNWGYDGVFPFAVQTSYGGPSGLKRFVDACHRRRIAVILDVVYNHLGPEGNYLWRLGAFFKEMDTPWGKAVNFDGPHSDGVRAFFLQNALSWFSSFHVDALRVDAVHGIFDFFGGKHFLSEMKDEVEEYDRSTGERHYLIAESDLNDARIVRPRLKGGHGWDGVWNDDYHHVLHTLLTGEQAGYYSDFHPRSVRQLARALEEGYVYSGQRSAFRKRRHGNSAAGIDGKRFVAFLQNHDQVGNRALGERIASLAGFEELKLGAAAVLLSPFTPLLFMGEEYGEERPFLYFIDHSDRALVEAVIEGRKREFGERERELPNPKECETFERSKIDPSKRFEGSGKLLWSYYRELIALRRRLPTLRESRSSRRRAMFDDGSLTVQIERWSARESTLVAFNFGEDEMRLHAPDRALEYSKTLDSSDERWGGPGGASETKTTRGEAFAIRPKSAILLRGSL